VLAVGYSRFAIVEPPRIGTMTPLPSVVLLDLDDTILDDSGARDRCWQTACAEAAPQRHGLDADELQREVEAVRDWFWSDSDRHREWRQQMREAWARIAADALARLGVDDPALAIWIGDRHAELRDAAICPLPGAIEALSRLRGEGARLGLITNGGSEGQRAKIERFDLACHFEYIGVEGEVGFGKPHRVAYETALARLGVGAEDCWMVGDNLEWDVAGAQAVGIHGIWLDRHARGLSPRSEIVPGRVITSIAELV
jgi:putative hydrolase of the HAD superfamily